MNTTYDSWIQPPPVIPRRRRFRLIGETQVFVEVARYNGIGSITSIMGISLCGRFSANLQLHDAIFLS